MKVHIPTRRWHNAHCTKVVSLFNTLFVASCNSDDDVPAEGEAGEEEMDGVGGIVRTLETELEAEAEEKVRLRSGANSQPNNVAMIDSVDGGGEGSSGDDSRARWDITFRSDLTCVSVFSSSKTPEMCGLCRRTYQRMF